MSPSAFGGGKHMVVGLGQGLMLRRCRHAIGSMLIEQIAEQQNLSWSLYPTLGAYVAECYPRQQRRGQQDRLHSKNRGYDDENNDDRARGGGQQLEKSQKYGGLYTTNDNTAGCRETTTTSTILVWPLLPYNLSGFVVSACASRFRVKAHNITIIHDDLDTKVGKIKWRTEGFAGSSNKGVRSILQSLGTDKIKRLRIGIGRPTSKDKAAVISYVLNNIPDKDLDLIQETFHVDAIVDELI